MWEASLQNQKQIKGKYILEIQAVKPDKRRRDIDNLGKSVSDLLVTMGLIEDDHLCQKFSAEWVREGVPCCVIVKPVEDQDGI